MTQTTAPCRASNAVTGWWWPPREHWIEPASADRFPHVSDASRRRHGVVVGRKLEPGARTGTDGWRQQ